MSAMLEISSVKGEVGDHESVALIRPRNRFAHQKSPRVLAVAIGESKCIGKVGEPVQVHVCKVTRAFNAVVNVQPSEPSIEPRDSPRIVELEEVSGNFALAACREHGAR